MLDFLIWCVYLQVFIAISIILGDGLYNLVKIFFIISREFCNAQSKQRNLPVQSLEGNLLLLSCHVSYNVFTSYCEMSFCLESITWVISCSVLQKVYLFFTCAYCVGAIVFLPLFSTPIAILPSLLFTLHSHPYCFKTKPRFTPSPSTTPNNVKEDNFALVNIPLFF